MISIYIIKHKIYSANEVEDHSCSYQVSFGESVDEIQLAAIP